MKEPRPADPLTVEAATAALDAARTDLGQEEAKLGTARGALADSERELERLGDVLAAGAPDAIRKAAQSATAAAEVQRQVVAACGRRVEQARARVAAAEAAITEAQQRARQAAIDEAVASARRLGEELEQGIAALVEKADALLGCGARLEELLGAGHGWPNRLILLARHEVARRVAALVQWHIRPPLDRPRDDLGAGFGDPERLPQLIEDGFLNWRELTPPDPPAPAPSPEPYAGFLPDPPPPPEAIGAALRATFDPVRSDRRHERTVAAGTSAQLY